MRRAEPLARTIPVADSRPVGARRGPGELPGGFSAGHWTDAEGVTGCTVVLPPADGAVASGEVRGGGPGTRETDRLSPLVSAPHVHAILLTGGSAFGLAAADGVARWLEERGRGHATPAGPVPLVSAAVIYNLMTGDPARRPGPEAGYAACAAAAPVVAGGSVGAGTGAAVGKLFGRERAVKAGIGLAAQDLGRGGRMTALAVVNAFGDVIGEDGAVLAGARDGDGFRRATDFIRADPGALPEARAEQLADSTTLVCLLTDSALGKAECAVVAKMAHAGMARAVDPVHSAFDGDVVFVLASGTAAPVDASAAGTIAAALTAEAIRDGVRAATSLGGLPALRDLGR
jgi:L-aminopeptidase/D-esterase-like protein